MVLALELPGLLPGRVLPVCDLGYVGETDPKSLFIVAKGRLSG